MTGIIRRVDNLGRIVIPRELRTVAGMESGEPVEIVMGDCGEIILRRWTARKVLPLIGELQRALADCDGEERAAGLTELAALLKGQIGGANDE